MTTAPASAGAPAPADGVVLIGEMAGSGYRTPPSLVRRGDGQVIQLTPLLYEVLAAIDGRRTLEEVADRVSDRTHRHVTSDDINTLITGQLLPLGLLRLADGTQPQVKRAAPLLGLRFRYVVSDPEVTRKVTAPFAHLFHPAIVTVLVAAFVAVAGWVLFREGLASATHEALYQPGLFLTVVAVTLLSAGFHEFGHAAAARYGGATPGAMGTGLYLIWPAFYTDVTDSYRLGRGGRVRTDLGGLYFNAIVAVVMLGWWWLTGWDSVLLIILAQVLQMIRQLAPLVRYDGYHVLADVVGVPDLYHHIKPTLLGLLPRNWGKAEHQLLKPWARAVVSVWVLVVVPTLLTTLALMVVAFPRVAATAWDSLGRQWTGLAGSFADGDPADMGVRLVSIVAIALPVFGMGYMISRALRRTVARAWRSTQGRPGRRVGAVLVALAVVAGLAWAWWPEQDRYRPIQSWERGTVVDAVPRAASFGLEPGGVARATTSWPAAEALPTPERPALSVVLVPHDGGDPVLPEQGSDQATSAGPGTWVFPFNRPLAPAEGDNQALAVNTDDGSSVYDVAFALVWAEDEVADNVNEAYAMASCTDCTTVAVAFQVVLVLGQSDVVPQNLAGAVNYSCVSCVTGALAQQLVLTLDAPLTERTRQELNELWQRVADYGTSLEGRSLSEIRARLSEFEREIIGLLGVETSQSTTSSAGPSPTTDPTAVATTDPSSGPSAGPSTDASPSGAGSPTTSSPDGAGDPSPGSPSSTTSPTPSSGTATASGEPTPSRTPTSSSSPSAGTSPSETAAP